DSGYPEVLFGTFHSIFYQILKESYPAGQTPRPAPVSFRMRLMEQLCRGLGLEDAAEDTALLLSEISRLKNAGLPPTAVSEDLSRAQRQAFPSLFSQYECQMRENGYIDFDDMVSHCGALLSDRPELLSRWRDRFQYLLIDEYQDINRMQFEVIRLLAEPLHNLFVVGDDDQSIYGFRGSAPGLMRDFPRYYPGTACIRLDVNFRSGRQILDAAACVIADNSERFDKTITPRPGAPEASVRGLSYESRMSQYEAIAEELESSIRRGTPPETMAVLSRTNKEASAMAQVCLSRGIPCCFREQIPDFYNLPPVRDLFAYLRFAQDGFSRSDYYRIMNRPLRYLRRDSASADTVTEAEVMRYYREDAVMRARAAEFFRQIRMISGLRPGLAVQYIRSVVGLEAFYQKEYRRRTELIEQSLAQMEQFQALCDRMGSFHELQQYIDDYREMLHEMSGDRREGNKAGVRLLTMHASKGLEFDHVWLPDLNEGILPARRCITQASIEEERRMLYVAMTRAKETLTLSYVRGTQNSERLPSRFLRKLKYLFH
ncbi:MAG: ATP-dependent helicase, partial [Butyrivibrio sp.]|nr:ATP-dependent helicase [Butyrivibrio sp.]